MALGGSGPTITAKFVADTSRLTKDVDGATSSMTGKLGGFATKAAAAIGGAFAIQQVTQFASECISAASDVSESMSKVGVVFGDSGQSVIDWSKNAAEAMGLSQGAALEAAGTYGNLAVSLGLPQDQAASMSQSLVGLASDMASFNNVPVDQALQALQSGLTGETEPLKKFGVNLNEAALKAEAMALGLSDGKGPLDAAAKAQASYSLIMKQSTTAQGDFARTSDGLANQNKINAAKFEDMKAKIGQALLPAMTAIASFIANNLLPAFESIGNWISDHQELILALGIGLAAVGVAILVTLVPAFIAWATAAGAAAIATLAAVWPFALIGVAIAALAYLVISNWDTIKAVTIAVWDAVLGAIKFVWDWVSTNWPLLLAILTGPFGVAVLLIVRNWDTIKGAALAAWDFITGLMGTIANIISAPFRAAADLVASAWDLIKNGAQGAYDFVVNVFAGLGNALTAPVKAAWNGLASIWNGSVGAISISIPDWVPGIGGNSFDVPDLPHLAKGGVLTSATLFVGGEAGREIVTPETLMRQIVAEETNRGSTYNLNMYPRTADAEDIAYGFRRLELMAGAL